MVTGGRGLQGDYIMQVEISWMRLAPFKGDSTEISSSFHHGRTLQEDDGWVRKRLLTGLDVLLFLFGTSLLFHVQFYLLLPDLHIGFSRAGQVVWYSHLSQNFPQFIVIHTVKVFGIVNKAETDVLFGTLLLFRWSNRCWLFDLWFLCLF